jgi:hypothetical protein
MKKRTIFNILLELKKDFIKNLKPDDMRNHNGKSFTRIRKLTLARLVILILRLDPFSLQIKLDHFYNEIGHKEEIVSKQAFSKARTNLDPEILRESFIITADTMSSCEDIELYKGKFRLGVIDGADVTLDNAPELLEYFGGSGRNRDCAMGMASLCYDPLNNIILDGGLYPYGTSERDAAREHFGAVSMLYIPKGVYNLYIFDRGYPSKGFFAEMIDGNMFFLMRVRKNLNENFDLILKDGRTSFEYNGKTYEVRVFNITLPSGEKEILVTNMADEYIEYNEVAELYFKRWKIEVKFDSLKNKLELENMSGRRVVTTYQDFWAKLDIANTIAALEYATDEVIEEKTANKTNKHRQRTNENRLITKFSERYIELLTINDTDARLALFEELVNDIAIRPVEVKPGRQSPRKIPRKKKFCDRRKRVLR